MWLKKETDILGYILKALFWGDRGAGKNSPEKKEVNVSVLGGEGGLAECFHFHILKLYLLILNLLIVLIKN